MRHVRMRKGVSSIMGTILVISITLALGALLFSYSKGLFQNLSQDTNVATSAQIISPTGGVPVLNVQVDNTGNVALKISSVLITGNTTDVQIPVNSMIYPGQSYSRVFVLNQSLIGNNQQIVAGNYYTVIFYMTTQGNHDFTQVQTVLAQSG